ncbi:MULTISPECIES: 2-phospho-L-lactate guanylyltransferase [unclassified Sphingobium]|uniref:2-phospho-L-lactate guanylyltransferase n=1 Tax=unclassified Sphingobium TaxID=2611147 RepID=UPI0035A6A7F4
MNASLVIAVRPPEEGKTRLAAALSPAARAALIERMFRHVLTTALAAAPTGGVHVISRSARLLALASAAGAHAIVEVGRGLNPAIAQAAMLCDPAHALLALSADLPLLTVADLTALDRALGGADVIAAPDRARMGTNALAMRHPGTIAPGFGAGSLARHRRRAGAAGLRFGLVFRPGLAADLDLPADLALLEPAEPLIAECGS